MKSKIYYEKLETNVSSMLPLALKILQYFIAKQSLVKHLYISPTVNMLQSCQTAQAGNTTSDFDQLKTDLLRDWTSLLFGGQLITDTYNRNLVHILIILFPVCA